MAFVAMYRPASNLRTHTFELVSVHPKKKKAGLFLPWSKQLAQIFPASVPG